MLYLALWLNIQIREACKDIIYRKRYENSLRDPVSEALICLSGGVEARKREGELGKMTHRGEKGGRNKGSIPLLYRNRVTHSDIVSRITSTVHECNV